MNHVINDKFLKSISLPLHWNTVKFLLELEKLIYFITFLK